MLNRRSFIALASGLFVPKAYSFVGGWALPFAFLELSDGRIFECVKKPAVRLVDGTVTPIDMVLHPESYEPVASDCYFPLRPDGTVMGWAGGNPAEQRELTPLIVRARCGKDESWWDNGKRVGEHRYDPDGPQAYL